jgi:SAM-dependent methyltransferase
MNLSDWDERYRTGARQGDKNTGPNLLVDEAVRGMDPGRALDLACGTGRNAIYLASLGWQVTAVDGAPAALEILQSRSDAVRTVLADLERGEFPIAPDSWDLILTSYYFQRDLFPAMRAGVRPGGLLVAIAHIPERAAPGELRTFFDGFEILHDYEGPSRDPAHKRAVAEIVARKPTY